MQEGNVCSVNVTVESLWFTETVTKSMHMLAYIHLLFTEEGSDYT